MSLLRNLKRFICELARDQLAILRMSYALKVTVRVGIFGMGKVGLIRAASLRKTSGAELVGFYDPEIDESNESLKGLRRYISPSDLLSDGDLDAVFVCTPNNLLKPLTISALQHDKHVFCEKPPGRNLQEFLEIKQIKVSKEESVLTFGFNHRHKESVREIIALVSSGNLGSVNWIRCRYGKNLRSESSDWRGVPEQVGGGILLDQGIHGLDIILGIMGKPDEVQSMLSSEVDADTVLETNAFINLRNKASGIAASLHSTSTQWRYVFALEISTTKGSIVLNGLRTPSGRYGEEIMTVNVWDGTKMSKLLEKNFVDDTSWDSEVETFIKACAMDEKENELGGLSHAEQLISTVEMIYAADSAWAAKRSSFYFEENSSETAANNGTG